MLIIKYNGMYRDLMTNLSAITFYVFMWVFFIHFLIFFQNSLNIYVEILYIGYDQLYCFTSDMINFTAL